MLNGADPIRLLQRHAGIKGRRMREEAVSVSVVGSEVREAKRIRVEAGNTNVVDF